MEIQEFSLKSNIDFQKVKNIPLFIKLVCTQTFNQQNKCTNIIPFNNLKKHIQ